MELTVTLVENRRVVRSERYSVYLNMTGESFGIGTGPTSSDAIAEAQAALVPVLEALRTRQLDVDIIASDEDALAYARRDIQTDKALTLAEYLKRYQPEQA